MGTGSVSWASGSGQMLLPGSVDEQERDRQWLGLQCAGNNEPRGSLRRAQDRVGRVAGQGQGTLPRTHCYYLFQ